MVGARWRRFFMDLAARAAEESKDPKTKVGAVIASAQMGHLSTGFNGFPIGCDDSHMQSVDARRAAQAGILHAEHNALIWADPRRLAGSFLFVTKTPCIPCTAMICQYRAIYNGPVEIYCPPPEADSEWLALRDLQADMLRRAGIMMWAML